MQKQIIKLVCLAICFLVMPCLVQAASFSDMDEGHYAYEAVEFLYKEKIIKGYSDLDNPSAKPFFKPDKLVNRVEALKMAMEASKIIVPELGADESDIMFSDLEKGAWYMKYIKLAKGMSVINGNPDGTYLPNNQVNKVEFLKMLLLSNKISLVNFSNYAELPYSDVKNVWYFPYLFYAISYSLVYPNGEGYMQPGSLLKRAEVAEIVYRYLLIVQGGEVQSLLSKMESLVIQSLEYVVDNQYNMADMKANEALVLAEKAFDKNSSQTIVSAAFKIANANKKITEAFVYYKDEKFEQAISSAKKAKELAANARSIDYSVNPLVEIIIERADSVVVLSQAG